MIQLNIVEIAMGFRNHVPIVLSLSLERAYSNDYNWGRVLPICSCVSLYIHELKGHHYQVKLKTANSCENLVLSAFGVRIHR